MFNKFQSTASTQSAISGFSSMSDDEFSSSLGATKLFLDSSLLRAGQVDLETAVKSLRGFHEKPSAFAGTVERESRLTYGIQNAATLQYTKGFPFVKGKHTTSNIFSVTLCPPHDLEAVSPGIVKNLSFDLGFSVIKTEKDNRAVVLFVAKNSPAALVGIQPMDTVKFAFTHTLSSPFRSKTQSLPAFGSVSLISDSKPAIAVYHVPELESMEAAEYAMNCVIDGAQTTFDEFAKLFPFDVTKSVYAHKPAQFELDEDPILYPVTVVFQRSSSGAEFGFDDVRENVDDALSKVLSFLGILPCVPRSSSDV